MSYIFGAERQKCIKRVKNAKIILDKRKISWYNGASRPRGAIASNNRKKISKKSEKTFEKGIDKRKRLWYNIKVAAQVAAHGH